MKTLEQRRAKRILRFAEIFSQGCSIAGPKVVHLTGLVDPLECEECCKGFVDVVRKSCDDKCLYEEQEA